MSLNFIKMGGADKQICRLCLDITPSCECETIDEIKKEMLKVFIINIDLDISSDVVACNTCLGKLQDFYYFKSHCITAYMNLTNENIFFENSRVCRLCLLLIEVNALNYTTDPDLKEVIGNCFPELDFEIVREPLICNHCQSRVKSYYEFMRNCEKVEQIIQKYYKEKGHGTAGLINLENMLKFKDYELLNETTIVKEECPDTDSNDVAVKNEENMIECEEIHIKEEELDKVEQEVLDELVDHDYCGNNATFTEEPTVASSNGTHKFKFSCSKCPYSSNYSRYIIKHTRKHSYNNKVSRCTICSFVADSKVSLKDHMSSHRGSTKAFRCSYCPFETNREYTLQQHMSHEDESEVKVHKCPLCTFKSKYKACLTTHVDLKHLDALMHNMKPEDILMYNWEKCKFRTNYRMNLAKRMLTHILPEPMNSFKCEICLYKCKLQSMMSKHLAISHPDKNLCREELKVVDELADHDYCRNNESLKKNPMVMSLDGTKKLIFSCSICAYSSNELYKFQRHTLTHSATDEVHRCPLCNFTADSGLKLKAHMSRHSWPPKAIDSHKANGENTLPIHAKRHKAANIAESPLRPSKNILKSYLLKHQKLKHERNIPKYRCQKCPFSTNQISEKILHQLTHRKSQETPMFKCKECEFETKFSVNLVKHMVVHADPERVNIFKCTKCQFESRTRDRITEHMVIHPENHPYSNFFYIPC